MKPYTCPTRVPKRKRPKVMTCLTRDQRQAYRDLMKRSGFLSGFNGRFKNRSSDDSAN